MIYGFTELRNYGTTDLRNYGFTELRIYGTTDYEAFFYVFAFADFTA